MIRSFLSVGALTMMSRILGLIRDVCLSLFLGAGLAADAFIVAFKLPNFFRRLFAEGAFTAAFVPLFSEHLGEHPDRASKQRARAFAEQALAALVLILVAVTALAEIFMPWVILALTGGFAEDSPEKTALAIELTRLTFPYLLLISLVALMGGILNGLDRYAAAAGAPILLNLCLIGSLLLFHDGAAFTAKALATAVSVAGIAQCLLLVWGVRRQGMDLRLRLPRLSKPVRRLLIVMGPAALGAGAVQVNLLIDILLASRFLPEGALSYLYYADRLNQLPLGVIGIAVATVLLPSLSRTLAEARTEAAHDKLNRGLDFALLITLPAAAALIAVPEALLRPLYQHGAFQPADTAATAMALRAYAVGLPAYVLVKILTTGFFARSDTKTPLKASLWALAVNLLLNLLLIWPLAHAGLALATALAAWVNALILLVLLMRRGDYAPDARFLARLPRTLGASAAMVAAVWALARLLPASAEKWGQIGSAAAILGLGLALYGALAWAFKLVRLSDLARLRRAA